MKEEIVEKDKKLKIVIEIVEQDKTIKDLKKDYPHKIKILEEALVSYVGENDLKILKTGFPDKGENLTKKLAYPYEIFSSIEDYRKSVKDLKKKTSSVN